MSEIAKHILERLATDLDSMRITDLEALKAKQAKRIVELEAQVLASDTVSKVEYAAMVAQRDTMREELKAARHLLTETLPWLKTYDEVADELSWLIGAIEALPPFRA